MARIFITGSTDGLGRAAARALIDQGNDVVLHARSQQRATAVRDLAADAAGLAIGDLSSAVQTAALAAQVNDLGRTDAVIHNAGVYLEPARGSTPEGHARTLAINVLAPYLLTALIDRPDRLVYLSSGMHFSGDASLRDIDWIQRPWNPGQAYADSKLSITALALGIARLWPDVLSNAVDPGWVPTKMGGAHAPDDLVLGHQTQVWLAGDPAATVSGGYWYHRQQQTPHPRALIRTYQDQLLERLAELTGTPLP